MPGSPHCGLPSHNGTHIGGVSALFRPTNSAPTTLSCMNENFNIYQAPQADLQHDDASWDDQDNRRFYVVSVRKFLIMYLGTLGLYSKYWYFRNFKLNKAHQNNDDWPVPKAFFSLFFTHGLVEAIDAHLQHRQRKYAWVPHTLANAYILLAILTGIMDQMSNKNVGVPTTTILSILGLLPLAYVFITIQRAINAACLSADVDPNDKLTWANFVWLAIGLILWACLIYLLYMELTGQPLD